METPMRFTCIRIPLNDKRNLESSISHQKPKAIRHLTHSVNLNYICAVATVSIVNVHIYHNT